MIAKFFIVTLILIIFFCLGFAMRQLLRKDHGEKVLVALSWRIGLSIGLFVLLFIGFKFGWIHPHGL